MCMFMQLTHPAGKGLNQLLSDGGIEVEIYIHHKKIYSRTFARSMESVPLARDYHGAVVMDLKGQKQGEVHLVDIVARYCCSAAIYGMQWKL